MSDAAVGTNGSSIHLCLILVNTQGTAHACIGRLLDYNEDIMSKRLAYGFETMSLQRHMYADVPADILDRINARDSDLMKLIDRLSSKPLRAIELAEDDNGTRMYFNAKRIGSIAMGPAQYVALRGVAETVTALEDWAEPGEEDSRMRVHMGTSSINNTGRYPMYADIAWADVSEEELGRIATGYMQSTAKKLQYEDKGLIPSLVYAQVSKERGVTLQTNPMGSCSLETDGTFYDPASPRYELYAHNIYNHMQQYICFAGSVALAHADILAKE